MFKLTVLLVLATAASQACVWNTDCAVGSVCERPANSLYGVCTSGFNPGNSNDRQPVQEYGDMSGKFGNTCGSSLECGIGQTCVKDGYAWKGVCQ